MKVKEIIPIEPNKKDIEDSFEVYIYGDSEK